MYRMVFQSKRRRLVFETGVIMYIQNNIYINYSEIFLKYTYIYIWIYNFYMIFEFDKKIDWWDRFCGNFWVDTYLRILCGTQNWRLRYTYLKYPVHEPFGCSIITGLSLHLLVHNRMAALNKTFPASIPASDF